MWQLAYHSRELRVLIAAKQESMVQREEVLQHLGAMEQVMIDLIGQASCRNIRTAQDAVSRDPPNFFLAGAISGACAYCHSSQ
jgi:hypothetical protein